jgi:hypothetical protein
MPVCLVQKEGGLEQAAGLFRGRRPAGHLGRACALPVTHNSTLRGQLRPNGPQSRPAFQPHQLPFPAHRQPSLVWLRLGDGLIRAAREATRS